MKDAVLHARISVGGTELMGADIPSAQPMRSAYLSLGVDSDAEAERIFSALSEGGEVFMPMQETFFATQIRPVARSVRHQLDDHPRAADECARVADVQSRPRFSTRPWAPVRSESGASQIGGNHDPLAGRDFVGPLSTVPRSR